MSNCTFIEKANLTVKCVERFCTKTSCDNDVSGLDCSESGKCNLRARCNESQTMKFDRKQLSPNVLCTQNNFLEFSCAYEKTDIACDPPYGAGHIGFKILTDSDDCETLVKEQRYNWNGMACNCTDCTDCRLCHRTRLFCTCHVRTFPLLSTSKKWRATTMFTNEPNSTEHYPTSADYLSTENGTKRDYQGYSTSKNTLSRMSSVKPPILNQTSTFMVIGITAGMVALCLLLFTVFFICRKRSNRNKHAMNRQNYELPISSNQDQQGMYKNEAFATGSKYQNIPFTEFSENNGSNTNGGQESHLYNTVSETGNTDLIEKIKTQSVQNATESDNLEVYNVLHEQQAVNDCSEMYSHVRQDVSASDGQYDELNVMQEKRQEDIDDLYDHSKIKSPDVKHPNDDDYDHI